MVYVTCFSGDIQFSNKNSYCLAKECFDNSSDDDSYSFYDSDFNDDTLNITICEDWKGYREQMVSICLMALDLDKDVEINIDCSGEESEDMCEIRIVDNKIVKNIGRVVYDEEESISEKELKTEKYLQKLYDVTKDKNIMKELMLLKMENGE